MADDRASYQYLVESIQKFHTQEELSNLARDAGFRFVSHSNLTGGVKSDPNQSNERATGHTPKQASCPRQALSADGELG